MACPFFKPFCENVFGGIGADDELVSIKLTIVLGNTLDCHNCLGQRQADWEKTDCNSFSLTTTLTLNEGYSHLR